MSTKSKTRRFPACTQSENAQRVFGCSAGSADITKRSIPGRAARRTLLSLLLGNGMRANNQLDLLPEVIAKAAPVTQQRILDPRGRELNCVDTEAVWPDCSPCLASRRHACLSKGRSAPDQCHLFPHTRRYPLRCEGCGVTSEDGANARHDLVVGADGVNSRVRRAIFPDIAPRFLGKICWRYIVPNTAGVASAIQRLKGRNMYQISHNLGGIVIAESFSDAQAFNAVVATVDRAPYQC